MSGTRLPASSAPERLRPIWRRGYFWVGVIAVLAVIGAIANAVGGGGSGSTAPTTAYSAAASTTAAVHTTTSISSAPYDQAAFNAFLKAAVAGTYFDYGEPGSPAEATSAEVYEGTAEDICRDLEAGRSEASIKAELVNRELINEPGFEDFNADVRSFFDALFEAATTFVCPGI